jgi:hypothetical protein
MSSKKFIVFAAVAAALTAPDVSPAIAQGRGRGRGHGRPVVVGRAVPRGRSVHVVASRVIAPRVIAPRIIAPRVVAVVPYRPYYYYRPGYSFGLTYGYGYGYPSRGYYGPAYPSYGYVPGHAYGGVRIDLPQRDAQVFVDGYYTGVVDQFDGVLQHLDLPAGPHRIEVRMDGYEPIAFDVYVRPGQTTTFRADMRRPLP